MGRWYTVPGVPTAEEMDIARRERAEIRRARRLPVLAIVLSLVALALAVLSMMGRA